MSLRPSQTLPDLEAEERAKEIARRFVDPHRALAFFVAWRDLHVAAQFVRERLEEFDGRDYVTLGAAAGAAAEALGGRRPRRSPASIRSRRRCSNDG
jgi:hypothetical protein